MQTHPNQIHSYPTHSDKTPESDKAPSHPWPTPVSSSLLSSSLDSQPGEISSENKERTPVNVPARALLEALKVHYRVSSAALAKQGIAQGTLNENAYIRSILSQKMNRIFEILSDCEPCSEYIRKVLIDDIDIEDIPHPFILETIRLRAELIYDLEQEDLSQS